VFSDWVPALLSTEINIAGSRGVLLKGMRTFSDELPSNRHLEIIGGSSARNGFNLGTQEQVLCGRAASVRRFLRPDMRQYTPEETFQNLHAILTDYQTLCGFEKGSSHEEHTEVAGRNIDRITGTGTSAVPQ
jgi:hypothetical protein